MQLPKSREKYNTVQVFHDRYKCMYGSRRNWRTEGFEIILFSCLLQYAQVVYQLHNSSTIYILQEINYFNLR